MLEYGCTTAPDKALVNFDTTEAGCPTLRQHSDGACFPWAGILIDQRTLATRIDFGYLGRFGAPERARTG